MTASEDFHVGRGSAVEVQDLLAAPTARIGDRVTIRAERLVLGDGATIGDDCQIGGLGGPATVFELGDHSLLGASSTVLCPSFVAGDYVALHNHLLANGYEPCSIGHNTWVGQNCVLN